MSWIGGYQSGGALISGGRGNPYNYRLRPQGGKGRPFTRKEVFGEQRIKNLYGPKGRGRVHYESRIKGNRAPDTARQIAYRQYISEGMKRANVRGQGARVIRDTMAGLAHAWTAQHGKSVSVRELRR